MKPLLQFILRVRIAKIELIEPQSQRRMDMIPKVSGWICM